MKITIYTINDCKFSQTEKQYLTSKNLPFEEKNLETNREYLTEMLNISNNFAGTPVTKIEKDDGTSVVLKGFTQSEFDTALGFSTETATSPAETQTSESTSTDTSFAPPTGVTTAAVAQTASENAVTPPVEPSVAAAPDMSTPPMDTMTSAQQPDTNMNMPPAPSMDMSPTTNTETQSMPTDTASDPVAANPAQTIPAPMGNPLTDTTPSVTPPAPSTPDFSAPTQGEAIPSTPAPDMSATNTPSMDMNAMPTPDMSMGQTPTPMAGTTDQNTNSNDPLNSVLNDLQSKGSN